MGELASKKVQKYHVTISFCQFLFPLYNDTNNTVESVRRKFRKNQSFVGCILLFVNRQLTKAKSCEENCSPLDGFGMFQLAWLYEKKNFPLSFLLMQNVKTYRFTELHLNMQSISKFNAYCPRTGEYPCK